MNRIVPLLICLAVASPSMARPRNRTLEPAHQPVVRDGVASVPGCPDWSDARNNAGEATAANFGCATASNLAAMLADPLDLVRGRTDPGTDANYANRAVKAWRETAPTSKQWSTTTTVSVGGK